MDDISPFEKNRSLRATPSKGKVDEAFASVQNLWPQFQAAQVAQYWAGFLDVTPDALPVISEVPGRTGLHLATGFSGHGFGVGPAIGRIVADQIAGKQPEVDVSAFEYDRFLR